MNTAQWIALGLGIYAAILLIIVWAWSRLPRDPWS